MKRYFVFSLFAIAAWTACGEPASQQTPATSTDSSKTNEPLVSHIYTADPSAHVFNGKLYVYPSHDTATGTPENDNGDHFNMMDFHVLSMDSVGGPVTDNGIALSIKDIPWAGRQLWAPDATFANGKYWLYFPVKDKKDIFRLGVAASENPTGPFRAEPQPIAGSYSIDPCVFKDDDGKFYLYFGGIWGGQLQRWNNNRYDSAGALRKPEEKAILPRVGQLDSSMKAFAGPVREIQLLDSTGQPFLEKDNDKRFFEAAWMHKYQGKYYLSYSTGDTHNICYATGDSPLGPFTYRGILLKPVTGWTNHQSIVEVNGKWFLFYHDTKKSGKTHLRNVKVVPLHYRADGSIETITAD